MKEGEAPTYGFDIDVDLVAGLALQDISHVPATRPAYPIHREGLGQDFPGSVGEKRRESRLRPQVPPGRRPGGHRRDRIEGRRRELLSAHGPAARAGEAREQIPPREYIFIVDVSGSMHGFPLDISKELMKNLIGNLRSTDVFNVLLFAGGSSVMAERSLPATEANIEKAIDVIDRQRGGGGTEHSARAAAGAGPAQGRGGVQDRGDRHRRLRERGNGDLRPDPKQAGRGQHVRLRHRQQRQPLHHRGNGPCRDGRALCPDQACGGQGQGRRIQKGHRYSRAFRREGGFRRVRGLRRGAARDSRRSGGTSGDRVRQVARQGRGKNPRDRQDRRGRLRKDRPDRGRHLRRQSERLEKSVGALANRRPFGLPEAFADGRPKERSSRIWDSSTTC